MSGYPYGNPQYPPPQGQIYPQIYNPVNAPAPQPGQHGQPGQPGYPYQGQYQPGPGYPYQQGQPPSAMSYPNVTPMMPTAPPGPGFGYQGGYPNVNPTQVYEPTVEWVPSTPNNASQLANRAVVAGYEGHDGSPLWVIRSRFEGDLIPGKLAIKHRAAYVPWGGDENSVQSIEVCCARPEKIHWVEARNGIMPHNAVVAGNTKEGEPLYVGRAKQNGSLTPGKVKWDLATEEKLSTFSEHTDYVRAGAACPISPEIILSGSYYHTVKLYDCRSNETVLTVNHGSPVESTLFLPSGGIFISAGGAEIKVWDIFNGRKLLANNI